MVVRSNIIMSYFYGFFHLFDRFKVKATPSGSKLKNAFSEIVGLYGSRAYRTLAIICHFSFFVSSLSYYVTGKTTFCVSLLLK